MPNEIKLRDILADANPFPSAEPVKTLDETLEEAQKVLDTPVTTTSPSDDIYKYLARLDDLLNLAEFAGVQKPSIYIMDDTLRIITESDDPLEKLGYVETQLNLLWNKFAGQNEALEHVKSCLDKILESYQSGDFVRRYAEIKNEEFQPIVQRRAQETRRLIYS